MFALISCVACHDLGPATASVGIAPVLTPSARASYQALIGDGVTLTDLRLRIARPNGELVVNRTAAISVGQDEIVLQFVIPLTADRETMRASLELLAGTVVLFSGSQDVPLVAGSPSTAEIQLDFVGPVAPPLPPILLPPIPPVPTLPTGSAVSVWTNYVTE